jgi:hypothetical protein
MRFFPHRRFLKALINLCKVEAHNLNPQGIANVVNGKAGR